ncbi:NACHT domain-containing protein [Chamaesiphon sp.]|uniref:NACHT domain-containing protein n=1 Tax=Chamaesiphon sp. TaxID=2814140 RepID=UPI0035940199
MPRPNYGNAVKQRATQFFTVLVDYANDELDCDERQLTQLQQEIQLHWQTNRRCVVRTKVRYLEQLMKLAGLILSGEQIKESIKCLTDFLGIVEDNRASKGGSETWHFTLNLWYDRCDRVANIHKFASEWDACRSPQSKRDEVQTAAPTDDWLELVRSSLATQQYHRITTNALMGEDRLKFSLDRVYVPLELMKRQRVTVFDSLGGNDGEDEDIEPNTRNDLTDEAALTVEQLLAQLLNNSAPNRIAIIGEPGAGKTTCLQKLAAELLDRELLPIWISLADLQGETLERYLLQDWLKIATRQIAIDPKLQRDFVAQFQRGRVWLLLDAVDEMAFDASISLANLARQFQGWVGGAHIILTCRSNVWDSGKNALENFTTYRNLSLSDGYHGAIVGTVTPRENGVRQFIEGWFGEHPNLGGQLIVELAHPQYQRLRDAIKNPLRLALLCRYWFITQGKLPSTKSSLYQQFTDTIYEWKQDRFPTSLSQRQQLNLGLGELALQAILTPPNATDDRLVRFRLHHHTILELLDPDLLELALRLGWLNQVGISATTGAKIYAFYHSTFQEYFAARSISDWHYFLTEDRTSQLPIFNPYWQETILFWFGRVDIASSDKEAFITALMNFDPNRGGFYAYRAYFLAATAIAEFPESNHSQEIIDRLLRWRFGEFISTQNIWQFYPLPVQDGARVALRKTDRVAAIAGLEIFIQTVTNPFLAWQAAHSLGKVFDPGNPIAIQILTNSIDLVNSSDLQIKICESLSRIDPQYNAKAIDKLVEIIHAHKTASLTRKAAFTLGKLAIANSPLFELAVTTLVRLIEVEQNSPNQVLKQRDNQIAALENLRQIAPKHPAAQQQFGRDRTLPSSTRNHRKKVAHQRNVSVAISELEQKLATAKNAESQRRYAHQLAKFQPGHPLAVEALLKLMSSIQPSSFYKRTGECLKEAILDEQLALVITTLKHNLVKIGSGDRSAATLECYKLLWYCAEQLPYQQFIDICDRQ